MRIIPAIDIIDGKCVRLTQGDYAQKKIYNENPLDVAKAFEDAGIHYLHLVDLDGAKAGKVTNWKVVESITSNTKLNVDFGGGIKTDVEIQHLFDLGITQVNIGSLAVRDAEKVYDWISHFGAEKIILSADVKNEAVAISGWTETSAIAVFDFIRAYASRGIEFITCTDISTDGMLSGPNIKLYQKLINSFPEIKLIASGGVSSIGDLQSLKEIGAEGAIVGKAFYEGKITLTELSHVN